MAFKYKIKPEDVKEIVAGTRYCYASDRVSVDGLPVGYMYREKPEDEDDSGWRFYSGTETEEYVEDEYHFMMFDLNYIANCDPTIVPYLKTKVGAELERVSGTDKFQPVQD
ncbi:MAG: DUF2185 domain-containing protein [Bacteroidales bacterium]|nr:DUF2185 domain-containing protein [Bacteroidales bacterium]